MHSFLLRFAVCICVLCCSMITVAFELSDSINAEMMAMKAKSLVGHHPTTTSPGQQTDRLRNRRGGPQMAPHQEAGCGGIAIGNVRPIVGDHRTHKTTVIIQGHVYNTGNRC